MLAAAAFSGGALPLAATPGPRPFPMYSTVGTDDPEILETGHPPLPSSR